jgi:hypothetical protein
MIHVEVAEFVRCCEALDRQRSFGGHQNSGGWDRNVCSKETVQLLENQLSSLVDDRPKHVNSPTVQGDLLLDVEGTLESRSFQRAFKD